MEINLTRREKYVQLHKRHWNFQQSNLAAPKSYLSGPIAIIAEPNWPIQRRCSQSHWQNMKLQETATCNLFIASLRHFLIEYNEKLNSMRFSSHWNRIRSKVITCSSGAERKASCIKENTLPSSVSREIQRILMMHPCNKSKLGKTGKNFFRCAAGYVKCREDDETGLGKFYVKRIQTKDKILFGDCLLLCLGF